MTSLDCGPLLVEVRGEGRVVELQHRVAFCHHGPVRREPLNLETVLAGSGNLDLRTLDCFEGAGQKVPLHKRPAVNSEIGRGARFDAIPPAADSRSQDADHKSGEIGLTCELRSSFHDHPYFT